jgi:hypothetical protein
MGQFNCYAYALRLPQAGWAVPGSLSHVTILSADFTAAHMDTLLQHDGLCRINPHDKSAAKHHIVAAFLSLPTADRLSDFHFYSFDRDGTWSHKTGMTEVTKHDAAGHIIENPERAGRAYFYHNYSDFVGYYAIPRDGIFYKPKIDAFTP